jgi:glyoxylase-like metal-dependent hydrolase (beta-lactamase superfamily II)
MNAGGRPGLRFPFEGVPGPGVVRRVAPGILWARMPLPLRLNHVNVWLLENGDKPASRAGRGAAGEFVAVDAGLGDDLTRSLWGQVLGAVAGGRSGSSGAVVRRIIVTHFHPDHSGAVEWLAVRDGAEVLMSRGEHETGLASARGERSSGSWSAIERLDPHGLPEGTRRVLLASTNPFASLTPGVPETFTPLADGDLVRVGSQEWRVMVGYGHSPEHVSLYSEGARVLISGDMLLPHISSHVGSPVTWGHGNPVAAFQRSLARTAELPDDTLVLPSHGVPFTGIRARVAALFEHHEERCDRILAAVERRGAGPAAAGARPPAAGDLPPTAGDLLEALFPKGLDPLQAILAMNETIAHLAYLEDRGDLRRVIGDDGKIRWERAGRAGDSGGAAPRPRAAAAAPTGDGAAGGLGTSVAGDGQAAGLDGAEAAALGDGGANGQDEGV